MGRLWQTSKTRNRGRWGKRLACGVRQTTCIGRSIHDNIHCNIHYTIHYNIHYNVLMFLLSAPVTALLYEENWDVSVYAQGSAIESGVVDENSLTNGTDRNSGR